MAVVKTYAKNLKVSYFPTFLVADNKGQIQMKDEAALEWIHKHLMTE